jgi:AcrR family transcriptional regulator
MPDRKRTQRERLLAGMLHQAALDGYADATIAKVIAHAGVSRPTFYEYFSDKDDCFVAVLGDIQERAIEEIRRRVEREPPQAAAAAVLRATIDFVRVQPAMGRVLVKEALAGGERALEVRDHGIAQIEQLVERRYAELPTGAEAPDVSSAMLVGCVQRLLASRLRREEGIPDEFAEELCTWIESYRTPLEQHRWRTLESTSIPARSRHLTVALAPTPLPPGRPRLSHEQVTELHRQRILFAAAEISEREGSAATTIRGVTKLAGVDNRVFHRLFADKDELFIAVHELHFQQLMASSASAFFGAKEWPDQVWEAGLAFAGCIEKNGSLARASFVGCYAGGPVTIERVEEIVGAFAVFLQDGYRYGSVQPGPTATAVQAITMTIFEIVYRQTRSSPKPNVAGLLPHVVSLALAPFVGQGRANELIEERRLRPSPSDS